MLLSLPATHIVAYICAWLTFNATQLLRHFDFQLVNPQEPMVSRSHALFVESGLLVRITESEAPTTII